MFGWKLLCKCATSECAGALRCTRSCFGRCMDGPHLTGSLRRRVIAAWTIRCFNSTSPAFKEVKSALHTWSCMVHVGESGLACCSLQPIGLPTAHVAAALIAASNEASSSNTASQTGSRLQQQLKYHQASSPRTTAPVIGHFGVRSLWSMAGRKDRLRVLMFNLFSASSSKERASGYVFCSLKHSALSMTWLGHFNRR